MRWSLKSTHMVHLQTIATPQRKHRYILSSSQSQAWLSRHWPWQATCYRDIQTIWANYSIIVPKPDFERRCLFCLNTPTKPKGDYMAIPYSLYKYVSLGTNHLLRMEAWNLNTLRLEVIVHPNHPLTRWARIPRAFSKINNSAHFTDVSLDFLPKKMETN